MVQKRIGNERCFWIKKQNTESHPWSQRNSFFFASGREALIALFDSLNLLAGDTVLLPAFVPEGIIAPCRAKRLVTQFYPLDSNLDPDWERLTESVTISSPKIAVLIHHFGIRRDAIKFNTICHQNGVLVLEDLAQAQVLKECDLGRECDFLLHSLTKIVGVTDGAILQVKDTLYPQYNKFRSFDIRRIVYISLNFCQLLINTASRHFGSYTFWRYFLKIIGPFLNSYRFLMWYYIHPTKMSFLSKLLLNRFPWSDAVKKRLNNEKLYREKLDRTVFRHLGQTEESGHCAMGYAVIVKDRENLVSTLASSGIYGIWFEYKWDYFPPERIHDRARWVMKHHFLFPTSYSLSESEVSKVISVANEWAMNEEKAVPMFN